MIMWLIALLQKQTRLDSAVNVMLAVILTAVILAMFCIVLVWSQGKDEEHTEELARSSRTDSDREPDE